jgi:hypothetical protein
LLSNIGIIDDGRLHEPSALNPKQNGTSISFVRFLSLDCILIFPDSKMSFIINGVVTGHVNGYGTNNGGSIVVPHNATYSVSVSYEVIVLWFELR